jgi:oligopeptide transport system permease protein
MILKKIFNSALLLWVLLTAVFFLIRFAPGGPFDTDRVLAPELRQAIHAHYGLNAPVWHQYLRWLQSGVRGDFGNSFQYPDQPVSELIGHALPISAGLGWSALLLATSVALPLGIFSASQAGRSKWIEPWVRIWVLSSVSVPGFLVASLLIWIFAIQLEWLPPGLWDDFFSGPEYWVLPAVTLSLRPLALLTRLLRSSLSEALAHDSIRTARAKGVSERSILWKHALRNAWVPVIGLMPPIAAHLLTGSFLVETVFQIPGLGRVFVSSVLNRDYPLVMATTLTFGVVLLCLSLLSDLLLLWADPRIRKSSRRL